MLTYKSKELAIFYEKLAQLYRAGVPITESLPLATMEVKSGKVRHGLERVHNYLMRGRTLTEGFSQCPEVFSELEVALIGVGETQGRLDQSLMSLSTMYEREYKDLKTFILAMLYPGFLFFAAIFLPPVVAWFTDGFSAYLKAVSSSLFTFFLPGAVVFAIYYFFKRSFPEAFDQIKVSIPFIGTNFKKLALARFSHSLATLFSGGVDLRRSIKLATKAMANKYLERRCRFILKAIDEGQSIAEGLRVAKVFPGNFVQTVAVGERTGELDKMLHKMAEYYEFEADKAFKGLLVMAPVFIYLCVAAYIAYIVISFYAGYFNSIGNILK
jgi:type II secretory pathway component PulF